MTIATNFVVEHGDCLEVLKSLPEASVDAVVTDPPYGLEFMGKGWDKGVPGAAYWVEVLRVLKPGGHVLAFGGTRTFHRLACAIEDAGFEMRDCLSWLYGTGFPKSLDVSKAIDKAAGAEREVIGKSARHVSGKPEQRTAGLCGSSTFQETVGMGSTLTAPATDAACQWQGWGTALKPAWEPIIVARKPLIGTVAENVQAHGTGAINVDGCRVGDNPGYKYAADRNGTTFHGQQGARIKQTAEKKGADFIESSKGRWPANVVLDEEAAAQLDEQTGTLKSGARSTKVVNGTDGSVNCYAGNNKKPGSQACPEDVPASEGGASRFFYCAKASKAERGEGNNHPTVKPVALMRWLVRLVTPPGGLVLDPFCGSGTTGVAAKQEGFDFVGIEQSAEYVAIATKRIEAA